MSYRKLNEKELFTLYRNLSGIYVNKEKYADVISIVRQYFKNPQSILINVDSEYNDNTYDNRVAGVFVYGEEDLEIPLTRADRDKFNLAIQQLDLYLEETDGEMDDNIVIYVSNRLPDVYVKE